MSSHTTYKDLTCQEKIELHTGKTSELKHLLEHTPKFSPDYDYIGMLIEYHEYSIWQLRDGD